MIIRKNFSRDRPKVKVYETTCKLGFVININKLNGVCFLLRYNKRAEPNGSFSFRVNLGATRQHVS